jgi:hypothetical protein
LRVALVAVALAGVTLALIHIRRSETAVRHEVQRLQQERVRLRRELWNRQVEAERITAPVEVRRRVLEASAYWCDGARGGDAASGGLVEQDLARNPPPSDRPAIVADR